MAWLIPRVRSWYRGRNWTGESKCEWQPDEAGLKPSGSVCLLSSEFERRGGPVQSLLRRHAMPHSVPEIQVAESFVPKKILRQHERQQNRAAARPGPGEAKDGVLLSGGGQPPAHPHRPGEGNAWAFTYLDTLSGSGGAEGTMALEKARDCSRILTGLQCSQAQTQIRFQNNSLDPAHRGRPRKGLRPHTITSKESRPRKVPDNQLHHTREA